MNESFFKDLLLSYLHTPYVWGGDCKNTGLDCSGFVIQILKIFGEVERGYDSTAQGIYYDLVKKIGINSAFSNRIGLGTLLFFGASKDKITHIAIALDDVFMIEAGGGASATTTIESANKANANIRIRKISNRKDLVAQVNCGWFSPIILTKKVIGTI